MKYCPECGNEIIRKEKFCSECGTELVEKYRPAKSKDMMSKQIPLILICILIGIFLSAIILTIILPKPEPEEEGEIMVTTYNYSDSDIYINGYLDEKLGWSANIPKGDYNKHIIGVSSGSWKVKVLPSTGGSYQKTVYVDEGETEEVVFEIY